jgi:tetratricopeptide (TPR) repeat protein
MLKSDLFFLKGKINHIKESYKDALDSYFQCVKLNPNNFAAHFNKAKIHFMNNEFPAAEESLNKVLSDSKYKECTEVIRLLAKVK